MDYTICHDISVLKAFKILAMVIQVIKILAPLVIIVTSIIKFSKIIFEDDDKATKEGIVMLFKKFIVAAFIFFIPTIISALTSLASPEDNTKMKFTDCSKCLTSPSECDTLINQFRNNNNTLP